MSQFYAYIESFLYWLFALFIVDLGVLFVILPLAHFTERPRAPVDQISRSQYAIRNNDVQQVQYILQESGSYAEDLLGIHFRRTSDSRWSLLTDACSNTNVSFEMITLLLDEIERVGGKPFLKKQLSVKTSSRWTPLLLAAYYSPSPGRVIPLIINKILSVDNGGFLRKQLEEHEIGYNLTVICAAVHRPDGIPRETFLFLSTLYAELGILHQQFGDDSSCFSLQQEQELRSQTGVDRHWTPTTQIHSLLDSHRRSVNFNDPVFTELLRYMVYSPTSFASVVERSDPDLASFFLSSIKWTEKKRDDYWIDVDRMPGTVGMIFGVLVALSIVIVPSFFLTRRMPALHDQASVSWNRFLEQRRTKLTEFLEHSEVVEFIVDSASDPATQKKVLTSLFWLVLCPSSLVLMTSFTDALTTALLAVIISAVYNRKAIIDFVTNFNTLLAIFNIVFSAFRSFRTLLEKVFKDYALHSHRKLLRTLEVERADYISKCLTQSQLIRESYEERSAITQQQSKDRLSIIIAFTLLRRKLQQENDQRTAPLRKLCTNHSVTLAESVIQKLTAERVIETGEFELLDSAPLCEMEIDKEDRLKVLKLVNLQRNKSTTLTSLRQEKADLINQLPENERQEWLSKRKTNHSMNVSTASFEDIQEAIEELEDDILKLTQRISAVHHHSPHNRHQSNDDDERNSDEGGDHSSSSPSQSVTKTTNTTTSDSSSTEVQLGNKHTHHSGGKQQNTASLDSDHGVTSEPASSTSVQHNDGELGFKE